MQDMLIPRYGRDGARYASSWGEKTRMGEKRYEATLTSFKRENFGTDTTCTLGVEHADLLVALFVVEQALVEGGGLMSVPFQVLWRATHLFKPDCGHYSGFWRKRMEQGLDDLSKTDLTLTDRGPVSQRDGHNYPKVYSGPLLRVFWREKETIVAGRSYKTRAIDRILWGPAIEHMLDERLTLTFRADEYFSIKSATARVWYLFGPAPAAARARDKEDGKGGDVSTLPFSQSSAALLLKLGYEPHQISDRYRRHRLLGPIQHGLDCRSLSNGHLSVSLTRHQPPDHPRFDWRLGIKISDRKPKSGLVEDTTFIAALQGGRSKAELYAAERNKPELNYMHQQAVASIWAPASQKYAANWLRRVLAYLPQGEWGILGEILAEVRSLKLEGRPFKTSAAGMATGLIHKLLRTHEWEHPSKILGRGSGPPG